MPQAGSKHQEDTEETDEAPGALELVCSGGRGIHTKSRKQAEGRPLWGVTFGIKMTTRSQSPSEETPTTKGSSMAGKGKAVQTRPAGRNGAECAGPRTPREGVGTILSARHKGTL